MEYPFQQPRNEAVFTCKHILEEGATICYVTHDEDDGAWQFMCGSDTHIASDARVIALHQAFDRDQTIGALAEMPLGYGAKRENKDSFWESFKI